MSTSSTSPQASMWSPMDITDKHRHSRVQVYATRDGANSKVARVNHDCNTGLFVGGNECLPRMEQGIGPGTVTAARCGWKC